MAKTKKEKKVQLGKIDPELHNKVVRYAELIGKTKVRVVEDLLTAFFKTTLLTNTYLELNNPFYISDLELGILDIDELLILNEISNEEYHELKNSSTGKATLHLPKITEYNKYNIIKKIPNNLDSFNETYNKFCYGNNPNRHKGVYLHHKISLEDNIFIKNTFYVFEYIKNDMFEKEPELYVTPISTRQLELIIDFKTHKDVYDDLIKEKQDFRKMLLNPTGSVDEDILVNENISSEVAERINVDLYLSSFGVMEKLSRYKRRENKKII